MKLDFPRLFRLIEINGRNFLHSLNSKFEVNVDSIREDDINDAENWRKKNLIRKFHFCANSGKLTRIFWQACSSTISFFTVGMQVAMVDPSSVRSFRMDDNSWNRGASSRNVNFVVWLHQSACTSLPRDSKCKLATLSIYRDIRAESRLSKEN